MAKPKAHHGRKAWLVTWEWAGDHAKPADKVVAIFNPHFGGGRVRELVEILYMQSMASLSERVSWALDRSRNPYPAQFGRLDNVPWGGEITCGHNPWLLARLVDDLTVEADADGKEHATWKERPKPDLSWIHNEAPRGG
jgi:hypothetical protein